MELVMEYVISEKFPSDRDATGSESLSDASSEVAGDFLNEFADKISRVRESLRGCLTSSNLSPAKNYIERDGFEILIQFSIEGHREEYEALISRVPVVADMHTGDCVKPIEGRRIDDGRYFEDLVRVSSCESTESPKYLSVPSVVRIKRADISSDVRGKKRYFSQKTSRTAWAFSSVGGGKNRFGASDAFHDVVETLPQRNKYELRVPVETEISVGVLFADFVSAPQSIIPANEKIYSLFELTLLCIDLYGERLVAKEGFNPPIEVRDILFGPLGFPERPF
jgi:hypothetical protein